MGSGETAPTMVTPHREIAARLPPSPRAVLLDTPYGFQENAAEISRRAVDYFAQRVQLAMTVAGFPGPLAADPAERSEQPTPGALARLRAADLVFSGPGSPTYALSTWRGSPVPQALADRLAEGGIVVFASAAAVTLGRFSLPVYEIYKVGQPIQWLEGLDLMARLGLGSSCAVIPHFDNAEGGTHDTRFCYMGERRLQALEAVLPPEGWVLGVDEHTALVLDLDAREMAVLGRGAVSVRRHEGTQRFPAGVRLSLADLAAAARGVHSAPSAAPDPQADAMGTDAAGMGAPGATPAREGPTAGGESPGAGRSPLLAEAVRLERAFAEALAMRQASSAAQAILALDGTLFEWAADTLQSDEPDRARAILHSLVHR